MKKFNKVFLIPLFCMFFKVGLLAQTPQANLEKYWIYRERLKNYVVSGSCQGCGLPAVSRTGAQRSNGPNTPGDGDRLAYNDETTLLGIYIGMLACEYKLLNDAGDPFLAQTKKDLYYALEAFNRLDITGEAWKRITTNNSTQSITNGLIYSPGFSPPQTFDNNGFFIRDDVAPDFAEVKNLGNRTGNLLSNCLVPLEDDYRPKVVTSGLYPADEIDRCSVRTDWPREESLDQVIELLTGLALVVKFVPNTSADNYQNLGFSDGGSASFYGEAKNITARMMNWIIAGNWNILDPATGLCSIGVAHGSNCSESSIHQSETCLPGSQGGASLFGTEFGFSTSYLQIMHDFQNIPADYTPLSPDPLALLAFNYSVGNGDQGVQNGSQEDKFLKLIAVGNTLGGSTMNNIDQYAPNADFNPIHTIMLNSVLYGNTSAFQNSVFECMLNSAYCRGVNSQLPLDYNWGNGAGRVLYGTYSGQVASNGQITGYQETETNGIDYMYYLTMYSLYNPSYYGFGGFHSIDVKTHLCLKDITKPDPGTIPNFVETYEKNFYAAENITVGDPNASSTSPTSPNSTYGISSNSPLAGTDPVYRGNVTFKAGNQIALLPGFSIDPGAYLAMEIDKTIGTNDCGDPGTYPQSFPQCLPSGCQVTGSEKTDNNDYGDYKVIPISSTQMYMVAPHQLFKINYTGGAGQDMFNIQQYNTLFGESSQYPYYLSGYQDFSGADYTGVLSSAPKITDVQYISNYNYSFYTGPEYTIISFDDGSMVKLLGTGGGGDDMFNIRKNGGCTSNVTPFCCGSSAYTCYFVGAQQFSSGILKTKFTPDFGGDFLVFLNNGKVLEVQGGAVVAGVGGGGTNMFAVTEPSSSTFAFEGVSGYNYYIGDMWWRDPVSCYYRYPSDGVVTVGLSSGKILKITHQEGGHQCFGVEENGGSLSDPFPVHDGAYVGEVWCGNSGSMCSSSLVAIEYVPNLTQSLAFFSNGDYALIDGEGGGGQSMYTGHWHFKGNFNATLTCYYVEGTTFYLGFSDGTFRVMDASNASLNITGSSTFLSRVTDFKKINGVYFICLANGAIIKVSGAGTGQNCFALSHQGHHFETICGWNYYIGDMDFDDINANRMAHNNSNNTPPPTKSLATTASIGSNTISPSSLNNVSISPNPNNGNFVVSAQNNSFGQLYISVLDGQGRIIKQEGLYNVGDEINFSTLEGGVYYLNIRSSISTILPSVKKLFINK